MFKLPQKRKEQEQRKQEAASAPALGKQMSVRSRYLTQEVTELQSCLPPSCKLEFEDVDDLREFTLIVLPEEGYWRGGRFVFSIKVTALVGRAFDCGPQNLRLKPPGCTGTPPLDKSRVQTYRGYGESGKLPYISLWLRNASRV